MSFAEDVGVLRLARIGPALDPLGRESGLVLLIEVRAVNAVRERLQCERPIAKPRDEVRRDLGVVADEVGLRVAVLGEEDLLEIRQLDAFALDLEDRRDARRLPPLSAVTARRSPRAFAASCAFFADSRRSSPVHFTRVDVGAKAAIRRDGGACRRA